MDSSSSVTSQPTITYVYVPTTAHLYSLDRVSNLAIGAIAFAVDVLFLRKHLANAVITVSTYLIGMYCWGCFKESLERNSLLNREIADKIRVAEDNKKVLQDQLLESQRKLADLNTQIAILQHQLAYVSKESQWRKKLLKSNTKLIQSYVKGCGVRVVGTEGPDGQTTFTRMEVNPQARTRPIAIPKASDPTAGAAVARRIVPILTSQNGSTSE